MSSRRRHKTTPYEKILIFIVILIFINVVYGIFRFATAKHIAGYEVRTGSLENNTVYTGIALRQETVVGSEYPGHINYYTREKDRLGAGQLAYTIDESGEVAQAIGAQQADASVFTSEDYSDLQNEITPFAASFDPASFHSLYEFKDTLNSEIQKITSKSVLNDINALAEDDSSIHYCSSEDTGYIVYNTDGYEGLTFDALTAADFNQANYEKKELENNAVVSSGDPAYKLETAEDWEIAIQLPDDETAAELADEGVIKVKFLANQLESYATVTTRKDSDGQNYADLALTNSMMAFCTDRFIQLEIITDDTRGLKIPVSALVDDEFYVIPSDYVTEGTGGAEQVLRQTVNDSGQQTVETVTVTPYGTAKDGSFYVDQSSLRKNDVLVKLNSSETFTVGETVKLQGVYNINEGYADFRQVSVLRQNDEYAIVKSDTTYGLREYDYIVLDADNMSPNEFIYE